MKTIAPFLFVLLFTASCQNAIKDKAVENKETPESVTEEFVEPVHAEVNDNTTVNSKEDLIGYWVGWFEPAKDLTENHIVRAVGDVGEYSWYRENKITISLDTIRNDSIIGHSIVAGNMRPFQGSLKLAADTAFLINLSEPGDDKYDGVFSIKVDLKSNKLKGTWNSYKKIDISKRQYSLDKKVFKYQPENKVDNAFVDWMKSKKVKDEYAGEWYEMEKYFATTELATKYNPSAESLNPKDVEKLTKADIYVLRNSIYAKHGYSFKKRQLRVFFDRHDWYMPVHVNIKSELTDIEKKNIKLLLRYEKYAEEYYDEFGRG